MRGITKAFPGVVANDHVDLEVRAAEIHALVGENGAGKSTLMNILYGLIHPDSGEILINGAPVKIGGPRDAIAAGFGMVNQHFMLIPVFTVGENIMLGREPVAAGALYDHAKARREIADLTRRYGLALDADARTGLLPVGLQQRAEIVKVLYRGASILILDEPTGVLTPQETKELFGVLRDLIKAGKTIIFISHKLKEVLEISDRITVMRRGKVVGHLFFQAEDGIRDLTVTGVQTCALPISLIYAGREGIVVREERAVGAFIIPGAPLVFVSPASKITPNLQAQINDAFVLGSSPTLQIGRAPCRERV